MRSALSLGLALALAASGCWTGAYLAQQGVGQLRLLHARRRISDVLGDPDVAADTKTRLALAREARDFGVALGLRGGDAFTRYLDTGGAPVAWNVTAADKDQLRLRVHHFPIAGTVPYLGFFREADAEREAARLAAQDLDVSVRPVAGYSTLGVLSDPIYSSMIDEPPERIVEVVLHEMLHGTLYLPGQSKWNESLATFVGLEGAALFFALRGGAADGARVLSEAQRRAGDEAAFSQFLTPLLAELTALYASPLPRADKLHQREAIFARAQATYRRRFPPPPGHTPFFLRQPLNNAVLLGYAVYHDATPAHRRLLARLGGDLGRFVAVCRYAVANAPDPIDYLERY